MTTVSIVEDDSSFCVLLTRALSKRKTIRVLSVHPTAEDALQQLPSLRPELVLMDIKLPGMNGIECLKHIKQIRPSLVLQVLMLTDYADSELVFEALKAGASGYLLKDQVSVRELAASINQVMAGGGVMSPNIARKVIHCFEEPATPVSALTEREMELLLSLSRGLMYKEIADRHGISLNTVRTHLGSIYRKLHVRSRTDAVVHFLKKQSPHTKM
jgi:DNA-binding NarL/FixJ family response regulator